MSTFRVFISYSHEDQVVAEKVAAVLKEKGLEPFYDKNIRPGTAFTDAIKGLIAHAHIFMPIITANSPQRPWVHQETGYAMALNIPVLPIAIGNLPGEMIAQLQAIRITDPELADLGARLDEVNLESVVLHPPANPITIVNVAEWPEQREELMTQYANRVIELGRYGRLRQRGGFTSFSIPDKDIGNPVWTNRDGPNKRSDYYHHLLLKERQVLERHARAQGCDLILDPSLAPAGMTGEVRKVRLLLLSEFLRSMKDDQVRIVCSPAGRDPATFIAVGDWFTAESQAPRTGQGWRQTVFTWHAPTVFRGVRQFDQLFEQLVAESGVAPEDLRKTALAEIDKVIKQL
jgi:hypothetical protein